MGNTMRYFIALLAIFTSSAGAQIELTVDQGMSSVTFSVLGVSDASSVIGNGAIELTPPIEPFGTAQFTTLNLTAADGFDVNILGGLVSIESAPGSVMIEMVSPGNAGAVGPDNQFDQFGNGFQLAGIVDVNDPFNLAGGSMTFDLSGVTPPPIDLENIQLAVDGSQLSVSSTFEITIDSGDIAVTASGDIVMVGELPSFIPGDVNQDGVVDLLDVAPFVNLVVSNSFQLEADINMDGNVDLFDVAPFVSLLTDG